ncbi:MAG: hypothetical protein JKY86_15515 [Gammaproteobacteria bacterium]|nr:hypothetical protein [Gammaproteobacteria bacterium]
MTSQLFEELGPMTKCNIELSAKQIWNDQEELRVNRVNFGNFVRCERYYTGLGPWHMTVRTYMQEEVITADTPYLVVQKANNTLADGWEELKLTRNGEL